MADADYAGFNLQQVFDAIESGDTVSLGTAAEAFGKAAKALSDLLGDITTGVSRTVGVDGVWKSAAADAFTGQLTRLVNFARESTAPLSEYKPQLYLAQGALQGAKDAIEPYKKKVDALVAAG